MIFITAVDIEDVYSIDLQDEQKQEYYSIVESMSSIKWLCMKKNDKVLAIFSFVPVSNSCIRLCALVAKNTTIEFISMVKAIHRLIYMYNQIYNRIECTVKTSFDNGHRLMKILNFKKECDMPYYYNNETYSLYSITGGK